MYNCGDWEIGKFHSNFMMNKQSRFFFPDLWASGEVMGSSQHGTVAGMMENLASWPIRGNHGVEKG